MKKPDVRVERTRDALHAAFNSLFFEQRYDRITVDSIARRAGVGRSTFYEHFVDKEDVLAATVRVPFTPLAACVERDARVSPDVVRVLRHFAQEGNAVRRLLASSSRPALTRALASMIEERLPVKRATKNDAERKVTAVAIAGAQLEAVGDWLRGGTGATAVELARVLHRISRAAAQA